MNLYKRKAYAKINLGLDVVRRMENGYHEVRMIMQTVGIYDELTFEVKGEHIVVTTDNMELPSDDNNLVYKAAKIMRERYQIKEGIHIHLNKNIPIAAGMAGGSTDAAAVFLGMNEIFDLQASQEELMKLGVQVGADVPYCIMGGTALAEGIGEVLTQLTPAPRCYLLIAKPNINVSTEYIYEHLHANDLKVHPDIDGMRASIEEGNLEGIISRLGNVLETVTVNEYPIISEIKHKMIQLGAKGSLMSGSGPTVFGIFDKKELAHQAYQVMSQEKEDLLMDGKQIYITELIN